MKVNFDGMRRNATNSMNELHNVLAKAIEQCEESLKEEIIKDFDEAQSAVSVFNLLMSEKEEFSSLEIESSFLCETFEI
ncbi:MAG: hypothetical protein JXQ76_07545 [Campylobacterales bacterium]|nr:hypothetical protein [Campylobacterales bacterium]